MPRGVSKTWVQCILCGSDKGYPRSNRCHACLAKMLPHPVKYPFTADLDDRVRAVYREARNKKQLSAGISDLARRTGYPRHIVGQRARRLGMATLCGKRHWTPAEDAILREYVGTRTWRWIARKLRRPGLSVANRIYQFGLSARVTEGYSQNDLIDLLGSNQYRVARWVQLGWLKATRKDGCGNRRFTHNAVLRFLRTHPEEYDLRRVRQEWFKGMIFPAYGSPARMKEEPRPASVPTYEAIA